MATATRWWVTKRAMARAATAMTMVTKRPMATASRAKHKVGPKKVKASWSIDCMTLAIVKLADNMAQQVTYCWCAPMYQLVIIKPLVIWRFVLQCSRYYLWWTWILSVSAWIPDTFQKQHSYYQYCARRKNYECVCADWTIPSTAVLSSFGNLYYDDLDITYGGPGF
jgi:hypothetical protein